MEETVTKQNKTGSGKAAAGKHPMTQDRASDIQSRTMKGKGTVSKGDFAARAARAAARNGKVSSGQ
jgi:predicted Zn-dependent protease